jgi:predicted metalloprotease/outer membrane murein-binding lipoprotein Lpp
MRTRWRQAIRLAAAAVLAATLLAGCASVVTGTPDLNGAPDATLDVHGATGNALDTQVQNALADVTAFWQKQYPTIAGGAALPPLRGGLYSVDGAEVLRTKTAPADVDREACVRRSPSFIIDNAAYCTLDDSIIWDNNPDHLVGVLSRTYGKLIVALVFAHEYGHVIQARLKIGRSGNVPTIDTESQADCAAGAFVATAFRGDAPHFRATPAQLDEALDGFLQVRDSTPDSPSDISHGNGFDRLSALDDGMQKGVRFCFSPDYFNRKFTERPYVTDQDYLSGGNETLQQVLDPGDPTTDPNAGGLQPDLNRYWKAAAATIGKTWTDVHVAAAAHPECGAAAASEFGYCPQDNTVYYSDAFAKQAYYSVTDLQIDRATGNVTLVHNQPADFALGALFAVGWGMAVRHQLFGRATDDKAALTAAICYTGAYAKDINVDDPAKPFTLSPPDMDEATAAMLNLVGRAQAYGARGTTGLQRVQAFVKGYNGGKSVC